MYFVIKKKSDIGCTESRMNPEQHSQLEELSGSNAMLAFSTNQTESILSRNKKKTNKRKQTKTTNKHT